MRVPCYMRVLIFYMKDPLTGKLLNVEEVNDIQTLRKVRKNTRFAYDNEWT